MVLKERNGEIYGLASNEEIIKAKYLMDKGKHWEAINRVMTLEKKVELSEDERTECLLLKANFQIEIGNFHDALELAKKAFEVSKKRENNLLMIDAIIAEVKALWKTGQYSESSELLATAEEFITAKLKSEHHSFKEREAEISYIKGEFFRFQGELMGAFTCIEKSRRIFQELGNKTGIGLSLGKLGQIYHTKGNLNEAQDLYLKSLAIHEELDNSKLIAQNLCSIGHILRQKDKFEESLHYYEKSLLISEKYGFKQHQASALVNIGYVYHTWGQYKKSIEYFEKGLSISRNDNCKPCVAVSLSFIGTAYSYSGNQSQALENYKKSLTIYAEIGSNLGVANSLYQIGNVYHQQGELDKALEHVQKALEIFKDISNKKGVGWSLNKISAIYYGKGEFKQSLKNAQKCLLIFEERGDKLGIALAISRIGTIHHVNSAFDFAFTNYKKCLSILKEVNKKVFISKALYDLIRLSIDIKSPDLATPYFEQLRQMSKDDNKVINQCFWLSKAMLLKTRKRSIERGKAQEIFQQISEEEIVDYELTIEAMLNLCELYLFELRAFGNEEVLNDVDSLSTKLIDLAKAQHSYFLLVETYLLRSKLALLKLDFKESQQLLNEAEIIAHEKKFSNLSLKISKEQSQMNTWTSYFDSPPSFEERIKKTQLENLLEKMHHKKLFSREEEVKIYTEEARRLVETWERK